MNRSIQKTKGKKHVAGLDCIQKEPDFIRKLKGQFEPKQRPDRDEEAPEKEDEAPLVVQLKSGDLTHEQYERLKSGKPLAEPNDTKEANDYSEEEPY
eukprot:Awhi_evm1s9194